MIQEALGRLLGKPEVQFSLETRVPELRVLAAPECLRLSLARGSGEALMNTVTSKDAVTRGQVVATGEDGFKLTAPVHGTVTTVSAHPDLRGNRKGSAILLVPDEAQGGPCFEPLDIEKTEPSVLAQRIEDAGVLSCLEAPTPLLAQLRKRRSSATCLVVLAADRDPGVSACLALLQERSQDAALAARLLGRVAGAGRVVLVCLEGSSFSEGSSAGLQACDGVEVVELPALYPETLAAPVLRRLALEATDDEHSVVPLEAALAALDAVRTGEVQSHKLLTLIGPDQQPIANYRVTLGTPIRELLDHAGIELAEFDKLVAGGPMRGFAQYSIQGSIDVGVDALTIVPAGEVPSWSTEPCINCGSCIDICPLKLQVQLIGRYAEFELFDRTPEFGIEQCFECGLCATVCTARRPLLQYIRLAKQGLEEQA